MIFTKDNLKLGLVLGLFGPLAGLAVVLLYGASLLGLRYTPW